jgi:hypothetical protein
MPASAGAKAKISSKAIADIDCRFIIFDPSPLEVRAEQMVRKKGSMAR